jgi:hypothetical protein
MRRLSVEDNAAISQVVHSACQRLHIVSCPSSFHFLAALKVAKPMANFLAATGGLATVLVDGITAHYYTDRDAKGPYVGRDTREGAPLTVVRVQTQMAAGLKSLQHAFRVPLVATKHVFGMVDARMPREIMNKEWQDAVTHRMVLMRSTLDRGGIVAADGSKPLVFFARWAKPPRNFEDGYVIDYGGIQNV